MNQKLVIPALRGLIGDWIYYSTILSFKDVSQRIKRTEEIHESKFLKDMIQRSLEKRTQDICRYLQTHGQRFFNALVVGVYDGDPQWSPIKLALRDDVRAIVDKDAYINIEETIGLLVLNGDEKLFAIDGQHRVQGIKEYYLELSDERKEECRDEVPVIFVAHKTDNAGLQRTRRLFTTLNRYAKPVSLTDIVSLDEDNVVAIVCRELIERHSLFKQDGRVSLKKGKSISATDKKSVVSITALFDTLDIYLQGTLNKKKWAEFKTKRPSEEIVEIYLKKAFSLFDKFVNHVPELYRITEMKDDNNIPSHCRNENGGDLLFRGFAFPLLAKCLVIADKNGVSEDVFLARLGKMQRQLAKAPWVGIIWDGSMNVRDKNQKCFMQLILWMVGVSNAKEVDENRLRELISEIRQINVSDVVLPIRL